MKKTTLNNIIFLIFLLMKNNTINTMEKSNIQLDKIEKVYSQRDKKKLCPECHKRFENLARHMRIHTGEKPYQCNLCDKTFADKANCDRHEKTIHLDKTQNANTKKCPICSKMVTHLTRHQKTHTDERPFQCRFCEKKFSLNQNRFTHEKIMHLEQKSLKLCLICSKMVANLTRHQKSHTGEKSCYLTREQTHKYITNDLERKNNENAIMTNNYQNLIELEPLFDSTETLNLFQTITHPTSFNQLT